MGLDILAASTKIYNFDGNFIFICFLHTTCKKHKNLSSPCLAGGTYRLQNRPVFIT